MAAEIKVPRPAELVAVTSDTPFETGSQVLIRVRENGKWGRWTDLAPDRDHGPDPDSREAKGARAGTDPLMTNNATAVQVAIGSPSGKVPRGIGLTLVNSPTRTADAKLGRGRVASAALGMPTILTRAQWGADESWRGRAPVYTDTVRVGFIHHTASTSNYTAEQSAAQIRAIYAYHTKSLKHSDIDYNFVVDRFGRLYEGRYGGMDQAVQGGHTAGFNEHSFAVVALGNLEKVSPPAAEMAAIKDSTARLFAWKLGLSGVNPGATVDVISAGYTKPTKYPKGATATIPAASSHQAVNFTDCPGRHLQGEVPAIQALAASYSDVVLSAPTPQVWQFVSGSRSSVAVRSYANRAASWQLEVVQPCSGQVVRSMAGATAGAEAISADWDLRDDAGNQVAPGAHTLRLRGAAADGTPVSEVASPLTISPPDGGAWGPCPPGGASGSAAPVVAGPAPTANVAPVLAVTATPTATTTRKLHRTKAAPEPVRKGSQLRITAKVTAKFTDAKWRPAPAGIPYKLYFKKSGTKNYVLVSSGATATGRVSDSVRATRSGRWRVVMGSKTSASDYVRVKR